MVPYIFSEVPGKPQPLRPYLIDLGNGRLRGAHLRRAREDRTSSIRVFPQLEPAAAAAAESKRHAFTTGEGRVLEEFPKNVIPPEEPEKIRPKLRWAAPRGIARGASSPESRGNPPAPCLARRRPP